MVADPSFSASSEWLRFHAAVVGDQALLTILLATPDVTSFTRTAVEMASGQGISLVDADITAMFANARHEWLTRNTT